MLRPRIGSDDGFIVNSWLRSFSCSPMALSVTPHDGTRHTRACEHCGAHELRGHKVDGHTRYRAGDTYWSGQKALIGRLLASCNVTVWDSDGLLDGWICREWAAPTLHYVYVRRSARKAGVARALVADLAGQAVDYTHIRPGVHGHRLPAGWLYDPYKLTEAA